MADTHKRTDQILSAPTEAEYVAAMDRYGTSHWTAADDATAAAWHAAGGADGWLARQREQSTDSGGQG